MSEISEAISSVTRRKRRGRLLMRSYTIHIYLAHMYYVVRLLEVTANELFTVCSGLPLNSYISVDIAARSHQKQWCASGEIKYFTAVLW